MKTYNTLENGSITDGTRTIPTTHRWYRQALEEVEAGEAEILPYVEPPITNDQLIAELEASITPRNLRGAALGDEYSLAKIADVEAQINALR